jgi:hypothetical protein
VAILMALAPMGAASPVQPRVTLAAPYTGSVENGSVMLSNSCGTYASPVVPAFALATGVAKASVSVTAKNCAPAFVASEGAAEIQLGYISAGFTATKGLHKVVATWNLVYTTTIKTTMPTLTGTVYAEDDIEIAVEIYDATNGTTFYGSAPFTQLNFSTGGMGGMFHSSTTQKGYVNATLAKGHTYYIETFVIVNMDAYVLNSAKGTASVKFNMGSAGNQAKLTSVTRT